jgi:hypothetical protein
LPFSGTDNQPLVATPDGFSAPASSVTLDSRRVQGVYCRCKTGDKWVDDEPER